MCFESYDKAPSNISPMNTMTKSSHYTENTTFQYAKSIFFSHKYLIYTHIKNKIY